MTARESKAVVDHMWEEFFIQGNLDKADEFSPPTTSTMILLLPRIGTAPRN